MLDCRVKTTGCSLSELPQVKLFLNKLALADKQIVFNSNQQPQPGKKRKGDKLKTVTNPHSHAHTDHLVPGAFRDSTSHCLNQDLHFDKTLRRPFCIRLNKEQKFGTEAAKMLQEETYVLCTISKKLLDWFVCEVQIIFVISVFYVTATAVWRELFKLIGSLNRATSPLPVWNCQDVFLAMLYVLYVFRFTLK